MEKLSAYFPVWLPEAVALLPIGTFALWAILRRPFADRRLCLLAASGVSAAESLRAAMSMGGLEYLSPLEASLYFWILCTFVAFCFLVFG